MNGQTGYRDDGMASSSEYLPDPRTSMPPNVARRLRVTWASLILMILVAAIAFSFAAHAVAAGMTVFGLGSLGIAGAALNLDRYGYTVHESFSSTLKRVAAVGLAVCVVATIVTAPTVVAHGQSTPAFVIAFAAAVLTASITIGAATR